MKKVLLLAVILAGCTKPSVQVPQEPQRYSKLPTATEVFNLRTKCAKLGEELDEAMLHGPAVSRETVSNYNSKSNRCYVTLNDTSGKPSHWHTLFGLYDGQTRELLAVAEKYSNQADGGTHGSIYMENNVDTLIECHDGGDCGFRKTADFINEKMKREE
jgi:hypothetical protein